jgi:hypothetical protein
VCARKDAKESVSEDAYHASGMLWLRQHEIAGRVAGRACHPGRRGPSRSSLPAPYACRTTRVPNARER